MSANLQVSGTVTARLVVQADKELIAESIAIFDSFDQNANNLDHKLRMFGSSMQLMGFSVGVQNATYHARKALMRLQFHVRENAACLYENRVKPNAKKQIHDVKPDLKIDGRILILPPREKNQEKPKQTIFDSMDQMSIDIRTFVDRVNEISDFEDELVNKTFLLFANYLKERSETLKKNFGDQLRQRSFKERINKLAGEFGKHLEEMTKALDAFLETGVPTIRRSQEHIAQGLQLFSAVATFFSSVTASTIQYGISDDAGSMQSVVNGLWIMSLACSVASAISAQVAYYWRTSSSAGHLAAILIYKLKYLPFIYLCLSVLTFLAGLSVFTYSSSQHIGIRVSVTVFISIVLCQLVYMAAWFSLERLAYYRTKGERWFIQIFPELLQKLRLSTEEALRPKDVELGGKDPINPRLSSARHAATPGKGKQLSPKMIAVVSQIIAYRKIQKMVDIRKQHRHVRVPTNYPSHRDKQASLSLFLGEIVNDGHTALVKHLAFSPKGDYLATCGWDGNAIISSVSDNGDNIRTQHELYHPPTDASLNNPPSSDPIIPQSRKYNLLNITESNVRQVAWSHNGEKLATRTQNAIWIWNAIDGKLHCKFNYQSRTKDDPRSKEIAWLPSGTHIISLERDSSEKSSIVYMDIRNEGKVVTQKPIDGVNVCSIGVVNESCIIAAGTCLPINQTPLKPGELPMPKSKSDAEKIILYFDFIQGKTRYKAPLSGEVRSISLTVLLPTKILILVSYKYLGAGPELWTINLYDASPEFLRQRTYSTSPKILSADSNNAKVLSACSTNLKAQVNFSGRGCFGGPKNKYVCCSSQEGEIFIWDRETGLPLCTIQPCDEEHIKFFACNNKESPDFLCVSGAVDGVVTIWTSREPPRRSQVISPDQMDLDDMGYFAENNGGPALIEGPYCS